MTGDGQLVELSASAQFHLDPSPESLGRHAFGTADPDLALRPVVESAIRAVVGRERLDGLLAGRRREVERATAVELQRRVDAYGYGLIIDGVSLQDVRPPLAVADAYHDVSRAEGDRSRRIVEAKTYRLERTETAKGQASAVRNAAEAHRTVRTLRASGEADAFVARVLARAPMPALTDHRLYWEALALALAGKPKLLIDPDKARRHLILQDAPPVVISPIINDTMNRIKDESIHR